MTSQQTGIEKHFDTDDRGLLRQIRSRGLCSAQGEEVRQHLINNNIKYLSEPLTINTPSRQLRSASAARLFRIPSFKTKTNGQRSFSLLYYCTALGTIFDWIYALQVFIMIIIINVCLAKFFQTLSARRPNNGIRVVLLLHHDNVIDHNTATTLDDQETSRVQLVT